MHLSRPLPEPTGQSRTLPVATFCLTPYLDGPPVVAPLNTHKWSPWPTARPWVGGCSVTAPVTASQATRVCRGRTSLPPGLLRSAGYCSGRGQPSSCRAGDRYFWWSPGPAFWSVSGWPVNLHLSRDLRGRGTFLLSTIRSVPGWKGRVLRRHRRDPLPEDTLPGVPETDEGRSPTSPSPLCPRRLGSRSRSKSLSQPRWQDCGWETLTPPGQEVLHQKPDLVTGVSPGVPRPLVPHLRPHRRVSGRGSLGDCWTRRKGTLRIRHSRVSRILGRWTLSHSVTGRATDTQWAGPGEDKVAWSSVSWEMARPRPSHFGSFSLF